MSSILRQQWTHSDCDHCESQEVEREPRGAVDSGVGAPAAVRPARSAGDEEPPPPGAGGRKESQPNSAGSGALLPQSESPPSVQQLRSTSLDLARPATCGEWCTTGDSSALLREGFRSRLQSLPPARSLPMPFLQSTPEDAPHHRSSHGTMLRSHFWNSGRPSAGSSGINKTSRVVSAGADNMQQQASTTVSARRSAAVLAASTSLLGRAVQLQPGRIPSSRSSGSLHDLFYAAHHHDSPTSKFSNTAPCPQRPRHNSSNAQSSSSGGSVPDLRAFMRSIPANAPLQCATTITRPQLPVAVAAAVAAAAFPSLLLFDEADGRRERAALLSQLNVRITSSRPVRLRVCN